jgi:hypothetical protein
MAIFHPTRAGGLTGKAGQTVIEVTAGFIRHGLSVQHGSNQFDASPGALQFKACRKIGRAGGIAKSAVHAPGNQIIQVLWGLYWIVAIYHGDRKIPAGSNTDWTPD